jgi:cytochrome c peroxidase
MLCTTHEEFGTNYDEIAAKLSSSEEYRKAFRKAYNSEKITKHAITNAMSKYVSSLRSFNSEFDRYVRGEVETISEEVRRGYNLFQGKAACATCHFAPTFAGVVPPFYNETETEVLGVPAQKSAPYTLDTDLGRYSNGIITERADFFMNSFKTPTLRNIELTATLHIRLNGDDRAIFLFNS